MWGFQFAPHATGPVEGMSQSKYKKLPVLNLDTKQMLWEPYMMHGQRSLHREAAGMLVSESEGFQNLVNLHPCRADAQENKIGTKGG